MYLLDCLKLCLDFLLKTGRHYKRKAIEANVDVLKIKPNRV